jgi:hypothetical protein
MPLDVLGRTRATMTHSSSTNLARQGSGNLVKVRRDGD